MNNRFPIFSSPLYKRSIVGALFIAVTAAPVVADNYTDAILADSPSLFYNFQDTGSTVNDLGSSNIDGTASSATQGVVSGPVPTTYRGFSTNNKAVSFGGAGSVAMSTPSLAGVLNGSSQITVEMWINPDSIGSQMALLNIPIYENSASYSTGLAVTLMDTGNIRLAGRSTAGGTYRSNIYTDTSISAGEWTYLAGVFDYANDTLALYINGSIVDTVSVSWDDTTFNISEGTGTAYESAIGATLNDGGVQYFYSGDLDEVAIYTEALSSTQISNHYNAAVVPEPRAYAILASVCIFILAAFRNRRKRSI